MVSQTLRGHSRDTFWTLRSGPKGPRDTPRDTPGDTPVFGDTLGDTAGDTSGPKGPRDPCSRPGGTQSVARKEKQGWQNDSELTAISATSGKFRPIPHSSVASYQQTMGQLPPMGQLPSSPAPVGGTQGKTKGQQLKGKIVSYFFALFHTFSPRTFPYNIQRGGVSQAGAQTPVPPAPIVPPRIYDVSLGFSFVFLCLALSTIGNVPSTTTTTERLISLTAVIMLQ